MGTLLSRTDPHSQFYSYPASMALASVIVYTTLPVSVIQVQCSTGYNSLLSEYQYIRGHVRVHHHVFDVTIAKRWYLFQDYSYGKDVLFIPFIFSVIDLFIRYSNTLLVTFNNRIAMRGLLKPAICEGKTMCTRQQTDIVIKIDTSQTAVSSCSQPSTHLARYESHVGEISIDIALASF